VHVTGTSKDAQICRIWLEPSEELKGAHIRSGVAKVLHIRSMHQSITPELGRQSRVRKKSIPSLSQRADGPLVIYLRYLPSVYYRLRISVRVS
jgi:hypothetical protein